MTIQQSLVLDLAVIAFFVGVITLAVRVSRREKISVLKLLLGFTCYRNMTRGEQLFAMLLLFLIVGLICFAVYLPKLTEAEAGMLSNLSSITPDQFPEKGG